MIATITTLCVLLHHFIVHASQPCPTASSLFPKECPSDVFVHWHDIPPYIYTNATGNLTGILKTVTEGLVRECCGACVNFHYNDSFRDSNQLETEIGTGNSSISLPVYGTVSSELFQEQPYVPIVESPGIVYVTKEPYVGKASALLLKSVTDCWPILVLIFMMSAVFGIVMWATDSYFNPEQFPSPFYMGSWRGFWWALVSMTTVGYGDKAPRGLPGRTIAFVWILIGLVLYSVFSGYVSTESTAAALGSDIDLVGTNVVAFNQSQEQRFGMKSNANVTKVTTIDQFIEYIQDESVSGGLMDSYFAGVYQDRFKKEKIIVGTIFDYQFTYGFVLSNPLSNTQIKKCIIKGMSMKEKYVMTLIQSSMSALPELTEEELAKLSTALFDPYSPIFREAVMVIGIILILMICSGVVWEYFYNRPRRKMLEHEVDVDVEMVKKVSTHSDARVYECMEELMSGQNREIETLMIAEINAFINAFNRREDDFQQLLRDPSFQEMLPALMLNKDIRFVQYT